MSREQMDFVTNPDVCRNRHGGNAESEQANNVAHLTKAQQRERVLRAIRESASGMSCKELAALWGVGMNTISGRFTELKARELIRKIGTRSGSAVYEVV